MHARTKPRPGPLARCAPVAALALALVAAPALADSAYTTLDIDDCTILERFEGGGFDAQCPGYEDIPVFLSEGDARMEVDYGVRNDAFEGFGAFNSAGETIEWYSDAEGVAAGILRFTLSVDGESAEALVVSRVGEAGAPGCVVGVVDVDEDQANGVARGMAALARQFDCSRARAPVITSPDSLVSTFNPANR